MSTAKSYQDREAEIARFWAAWAVAVGALGVVITSALYAASPPQAALPMPNPVMIDALRETVSGRVTLVAAGTIGVIADVILAAGAFVMMINPRPTRLSLESLGWAWIALGTLIFVGVDGLSAGVLTQITVSDTSAVALYAVLKGLYNILFIVGTLAASLGGGAIFLSERTATPSLLPRFIIWIGLAFTLAGVIACLLYFAGINLAPLIGGSIGIVTLIFIFYGVQIARSARRIKN